MIELPESIIYARQMNEKITNHRITSVIMNQSPHKFAFFNKDASEYAKTLEGLKILKVHSIAGFIEIEFEDYKLAFSDGAYPKYHKPGDKLPKNHQMYMGFEDGSSVTVGIQMYGCIFLAWKEDTINEYYTAALKSPSPLSEDFTYEYFYQLYEDCSKKKSAKAFLATEQRIPGIGNGVLQDILFLSNVHPKRAISELSEEDLHNLYDHIISVLTSMVEEGGRDTEKDFFGEPGKYLTYMSKNTYLTPCPNCGNEIRKAAYMGGTVYYCEHCQKY